MSDCDKCGVEVEYFQCLVGDHEKRIVFLEEEMEKLTFVVDKIHKFIKSGKCDGMDKR